MLATSLSDNTSDPDFDRLFYQAVAETEFDETKLNKVVARITGTTLTVVTLGNGTVTDDLQTQLHRFREALHTIGCIRQSLTQAHAAKSAGDSCKTALSLANAQRHVREAFAQLDAVENKLRFMLAERRDTYSPPQPVATTHNRAVERAQTAGRPGS